VNSIIRMILHLLLLALVHTGFGEKFVTDDYEPCHYFYTVKINIDLMQQDLTTGSILYNNITYEKGEFGWYDYAYKNGVKQITERHLRGCLSIVHKGACIRLCNDEVDKDSTAVPIKLNVMDDSRFEVIDLVNDEDYKDRLIFGRTCEHQYSDDELQFFKVFFF
jgi:hypothetical protein